METYDPQCERLDVALKALYTLWRRGYYSHLRRLGVRGYAAFEEVSLDTARDLKDTRRLLRLDRSLLDPAVRLLGAYALATFVYRSIYYADPLVHRERLGR